MKYFIGWTAFLLGLAAFVGAVIAFIHTEFAIGVVRLLFWIVLMPVAEAFVGRTSAGRAIFGPGRS